MFKKMKKSALNMVIMIATFGCMLVLSIFAVNFSSIFYILIAAAIGVLVYAIGYIKDKKRSKNEEVPK